MRFREWSNDIHRRGCTCPCLGYHERLIRPKDLKTPEFVESIIEANSIGY